MFPSDSINCSTSKEFGSALRTAIHLCLNTNAPLRIMGHCSPISSKGGNGTGGIMFSRFDLTLKQEILYSVRAKFNIDRRIFRASESVENYLLSKGKLVNLPYDRNRKVTHSLIIPFNNYEWEYSMIGTDKDAIINLMIYGGTSIRKY